MPKDFTVEVLYEMVVCELVPSPRVNVAADTLYIKLALRCDKNVGIEADVVDVIVPSRVFAKRADEDPPRVTLLPGGIEASDESLEQRVQKEHLLSN